MTLTDKPVSPSYGHSYQNRAIYSTWRYIIIRIEGMLWWLAEICLEVNDWKAAKHEDHSTIYTRLYRNYITRILANSTIRPELLATNQATNQTVNCIKCMLFLVKTNINCRLFSKQHPNIYSWMEIKYIHVLLIKQLTEYLNSISWLLTRYIINNNCTHYVLCLTVRSLIKCMFEVQSVKIQKLNIHVARS